ncbi:MAG: L-threonylcarbamoyladenylate synthase [Firmicutes bacterium]|nr:L-threonylcarbamoyladenylate synthase [[Eubacterium] siraeum]MCM1488023.1 L-threonylcarbamoyladenylate synthase [Bacillota bacterium]
MNTEILNMSPKSIEIAAELLKNHEIVAIPTETVYGLAGNGLSPIAVKKIFDAKGRPNDNPLILHVPNTDWFYEYAEEVPDLAIRLSEKFCPGPLTMIMPKKKIVPYETSGGLDTVAFRIPNQPWTLKLIEACGFPLAAPSANLSGLPSPTRAGYVYKDMKGKIPLIVDGGVCSCGVESTVIAFTDIGVKILRPGGVTSEMLEEFCKVEIDRAVTEGLNDNEQALSPGMKYKHYSPKAEVYMVECESQDRFAEFINENSDEKTFVLAKCNDKIKAKTLPYGNTSKSEANALFSSLRKADELGAEKIYVQAPGKNGIGLAVYNRLIRAAAFKVIKL